ncbi:MAG: acetolactate synthase small subunit [Bacteroidota bacterium]|jgi:acetolactate synthase, small subunit|nr:acetolactate synthase small subunit [Bacteroidota bacterium]
MEQEYFITAFSENSIGLLNRITIIFTRRQVNIESLNVSQSSIHGIHKFTIVVNTTREKVEKVTKQIEKLVEVLKAFYHTSEEVIQQEIAVYKVKTEALMNSKEIENLVRNSGARILEITPDYTVIEKTGYKSETQELFDKLDQYGVTQFTRSGTVAVTKNPKELLTEYLKEVGWKA